MHVEKKCGMFETGYSYYDFTVSNKALMLSAAHTPLLEITSSPGSSLFTYLDFLGLQVEQDPP